MDSCANNRNRMNACLYERNVPSAMLQPYLSLRSVSTKYELFPIVDYRPSSSVRLAVAPTYNTTNVFYQGDAVAPWSGFASDIDTESILRNQIHKLQRCNASDYVPSSHSDLYTSYMGPPQRQQNQQNQQNQQRQQTGEANDLFSTPKFDQFNPISSTPNAGALKFNNPTRQQIKG